MLVACSNQSVSTPDTDYCVAANNIQKAPLDVEYEQTCNPTDLHDECTANGTLLGEHNATTSLYGVWDYVKTISGNNEERHLIDEFAIYPPQIRIYADSTLFAFFGEVSINAVMIPIGDYEFLVSEQIATGEDERLYSEDVMLRYDEEHGLLRWTFFNPFSDVYKHHFFALNCATQAETAIAEEFLSQFTSLFFTPHSDELELTFIWDGPAGRVSHGYYVDDDENIICYMLDGTNQTFYGASAMSAYADRFRIFTVEESHAPLVIAILFEFNDFSSGGGVLYEIINNGDQFSQLGSMMQYHWGGPGPDAVNLTPFINETGEIIARLDIIGTHFFANNNEGNFVSVAFVEPGFHYTAGGVDGYFAGGINAETGTRHFTLEEFEELLATGQTQKFFPDFPGGSFVPMKRMYALEQELIETIKQRKPSP